MKKLLIDYNVSRYSKEKYGDLLYKDRYMKMFINNEDIIVVSIESLFSFNKLIDNMGANIDGDVNIIDKIIFESFWLFVVENFKYKDKYSQDLEQEFNKICGNGNESIDITGNNGITFISFNFELLEDISDCEKKVNGIIKLIDFLKTANFCYQESVSNDEVRNFINMFLCNIIRHINDSYSMIVDEIYYDDRDEKAYLNDLKRVISSVDNEDIDIDSINGISVNKIILSNKNDIEDIYKNFMVGLRDDVWKLFKQKLYYDIEFLNIIKWKIKNEMDLFLLNIKLFGSGRKINSRYITKNNKV